VHGPLPATVPRLNLPAELRCPAHGQPLHAGGPPGDDAAHLECPCGCHVPVVGGIARFVPEDNYASSFGLQWNRYRATQLDSHTGSTISHDRLARCLGGPVEGVRGLSVLEAGCGAGRFTEILLAKGARVTAFDLSSAVEANLETCRGRPGYFVCQADILQAPVAPASFDLVLCLGVVQHTPDPERTIAALASCVKPGGRLVLDHYSYGDRGAFWRRLATVAHPRAVLRAILTRLPPAQALQWSSAVTRTLLPLHRRLWNRSGRTRTLRRGLRLVSPVFDYYDRHPELPPDLLAEWSFLDTHDGLTDRYKHFRSREQIERALAACGMVAIESRYAGNGVEACARRPAAA
jgi:2-polyprenyl-3-methyl-5-hydroxy-6-metoxy-1,4-benzoquinol methylase